MLSIRRSLPSIPILFAAFFAQLAHAEISLEQQLANDLLAHKSMFKALKRDVIVYHWGLRQSFGLPPVGPVDPRSPSMRGSLSYLIGTFANSNSAGDLLGDGLYLAIDPAASSNFGGMKPQWAVAQMFMRAGTKYLDLTGLMQSSQFRGELPFSPEVRDLVKQRNCTLTGYSALIAYGSAYPNCKPIKDLLFKILDVSAIRYQFASTQYTNCSQRPAAAFVAIRPDGVDLNTAVVFTVDTPNDGLQENRLMLNALFERSLSRTASIPQADGSFDKLIYPSLQAVSTQVNMDQWMLQYMMGCGYHPEEAVEAP